MTLKEQEDIFCKSLITNLKIDQVRDVLRTYTAMRDDAKVRAQPTPVFDSKDIEKAIRQQK